MTAIVPLPQRQSGDSSSPWLCNVSPGCTNPAVRVEPVTCTGCEDVALETLKDVPALSAQLEVTQATIAQAQADAQAAQAVDDLAEQLVTTAVAVMQEAQATDAATATAMQIARLQARADALLAPHTHPAFACADHDSLIAALGGV